MSDRRAHGDQQGGGGRKGGHSRGRRRAGMGGGAEWGECGPNKFCIATLVEMFVFYTAHRTNRVLVYLVFFVF
jgi:hypothetical protein